MIRRLIRGLLALCLVAVAGGLAVHPVAVAQGGDAAAQQQQKKKKKKRKAAGMMSERTYKRLTTIHQLIGDQKYADALRLLDSLYAGGGRNDYERAVMLQTYGFIYAARNDYAKALSYLEKSLALDALPEQASNRLVYNVAQLNVALKRYRKGLKILKDWFRTAENPTAEAYALAATAHAQLKEYRQAIPYIKQAIERSDQPKESWFRLWLAMHYELKQYREAAGVLEQMVRRWPQRDKYWKQLSTIYLELKDDKKSLSTLELAYAQGFLTKERELLQLANLYFYLNIPYKAAEVLDRGIKSGVIEATRKHWEMLGNAWMEAQEYDRAIPALKKAAALAKDGEIDVRIAYLYLEKEQWGNAAAALKAAIKKGGLKNPGMAYIILGMTSYETKQYEAALRQFAKARKFEKTKKQADQWIRHIRNEMQALEAAG